MCKKKGLVAVAVALEKKKRFCRAAPPKNKNKRGHALTLCFALSFVFLLADPPGIQERRVSLQFSGNERKCGAADAAPAANARQQSCLLPCSCWCFSSSSSSSSSSSPQPPPPSRLAQAVAELPDRRSRCRGSCLGRSRGQGQEQQGELRRGRGIHLGAAFAAATSPPAASAPASLARLVVGLCGPARGVPAAPAAHEQAATAAQARRVRCGSFVYFGQSISGTIFPG